MDPRTLCACQPVAFMISASVAPPDRFSKSSTLAVLLPSRAAPAFLRPLGAFLAELPFLADLVFLGATCAPRGATRAFLVGFGCAPVAVAWAVPVSSLLDVMMCSPLLAVITAVTTSITPVSRKCKGNLKGIGLGEGSAMQL